MTEYCFRVSAFKWLGKFYRILQRARPAKNVIRQIFFAVDQY